MFSLLIISIITMMITLIIMLLASLLSKKTFIDREKASPFECGFDPSCSTRLPFSIRFFMIAIIFLIFDVEIALILPMIMIINFSNLMVWVMTSIFFIIILLVGLYHEWKQGALNWSN